MLACLAMLCSTLTLTPLSAKFVISVLRGLWLDFLFNVYTVTINGDVVLTGTDDYEEAKEYAEQLVNEVCQG